MTTAVTVSGKGCRRWTPGKAPYGHAATCENPIDKTGIC